MNRLPSALIVPALLATLAACSAAPAAPGATGPSTSLGTSGGASLARGASGPAGATAAPVSSSGVGGGAATAPVSSAIDACQILSDGDITAATGEAVTSRTKSTLTRVFPNVCDIELDGGGSLTVSVMASGGKSMYETSFEPFIGDGDTAFLDEAISGLGDKAGRAGDDDIMVLKDDVLFDVFFIEYLGQDKLSVVRYLAESVLARLPCIATGCAGMTPLPPPSTPASVDACALLTKDEIKASTGFDASASEASGGDGLDPGCTWTLKTDAAIPGSNYVDVELKAYGGRSQFDFLSTAYDPPLEHITGLGDDAIKTATIPDGRFYVVIDDRLITVTFSMPLAVDDPYALVAPLVPKVLARLQ